MRRQWLPETFFGTPTGIAAYLWDGFIVGRKLWLELGYTVAGTLISVPFGGSIAALALGLVFVMFPRSSTRWTPPHGAQRHAASRWRRCSCCGSAWASAPRSRSGMSLAFFICWLTRGRHPRVSGPGDPFALAGRHAQPAVLQRSRCPVPCR